MAGRRNRAGGAYGPWKAPARFTVRPLDAEGQTSYPGVSAAKPGGRRVPVDDDPDFAGFNPGCFLQFVRKHCRRTAPMAATETHVLRVSLSPKIYRDLEIISTKKLDD